MKKLNQLIIILLMCCLQVSCVQETRELTVTFEVDMRQVDQITSVGIIGELSPLSWRNKQALNDENGDGIFEATFTFDIPYDYIAYKFVLNEDKIELKGKANRRVFVKNQSHTTVRSVFDEQSYEHLKSLSTD